MSLKDSLPSPLARCLHLAETESTRLRQDYLKALSHLLDLAEIYVQISGSICLSLLRTTQTSLTDEQAASLREFLSKPLSIGRWVYQWKWSAELLLGASVEPALQGAARFIVEKAPERRVVLEALDSLPELRNRSRGHTFTLQGSQAKEVFEEQYPAIKRILSSSDFLLEAAHLAVVRETDGGVFELALMCGNVTSEQADAALIQTSQLLRRGQVVWMPKTTIETEVAEDGAILILDPLVVTSPENHELFFFQGVRGKKAKYMSVDPKEHELPQTQLFEQFAALLSENQKRTQNPAAPKWAKLLRTHELVCDATLQGGNAHPESFFRGQIPSWGDLMHELDVPRSLEYHGTKISHWEFMGHHLPALLDRATLFEVPLVLLTGHGGSGKTTILLRIALDLFRSSELQAVVLRHYWQNDIDLEDIILSAKENPKTAVAVFVDEAALVANQLTNLRRELQHRRIPALFFCAERANLWPELPADIYEIRSLDQEEAENLLDRLARFNLLGVLEGLSREDQLERLTTTYNSQLLVTLREATEGRRFDEIIEDEYRRIPSDIARQIYLQTCLMQRSGLFLPFDVALIRSNSSGHKDFRIKVIQPTEGVLVISYSSGSKYLTARHRLIAETLVRRVLTDPDEAAEELALLVGYLTIRPESRQGFFDAQKLLTSPENQLILEKGDLEPFVIQLRPLGETVWKFINYILQQTNSSPGTLKLAAEVLASGEHSSLDDKKLGGLLNRLMNLLDADTFVNICERAIKNSDGKIHALLYLKITDIELERGNYEAAITVAREGIQCLIENSGGGLHKLYYRLTKIERDRNNYDAAAAVAREGIKKIIQNPLFNAANLYVRLVEIEIHVGNIDTAAMIAYDGIKLLKPKSGIGNALLFYQLANIECERKNFDAALKATHEGMRELENIIGDESDCLRANFEKLKTLISSAPCD